MHFGFDTITAALLRKAKQHIHFKRLHCPKLKCRNLTVDPLQELVSLKVEFVQMLEIKVEM